LRIRLGGARGFFRVDIGGGFLHQRHHVAHAENAPRYPARMKSSSASVLFAGADQLDRLAGDARIDSGAPPRPSPSTRVSTMR